VLSSEELLVVKGPSRTLPPVDAWYGNIMGKTLCHGYSSHEDSPSPPLLVDEEDAFDFLLLLVGAIEPSDEASSSEDAETAEVAIFGA